MKIISILFLSIFYTASLQAQTDSILIYLDRQDKPCLKEKAVKYVIQVKEKDHWKRIVFDILDNKPFYSAYYMDSDGKRFDGPYTAFNKYEKPVQTGRYEDNKKAGVWKVYTDDGKLMDSAFYRNGFIFGIGLGWYADGSIRDSLFFEDNGNGISRGYWPDGKQKQLGNFKEGKKSGAWVYYHKNGMKCQEVQYTADSALTYTCYDEGGKVQAQNCFYEKEAVFKGGDNAWRDWLVKKLVATKLPEVYNQGKAFGTVYIQFIVDIDGKVTDVKAINSIHPDLDRIALNIIKSAPPWEPAIQYNRKVIAYRRQPITFTKFE